MKKRLCMRTAAILLGVGMMTSACASGNNQEESSGPIADANEGASGGEEVSGELEVAAFSNSDLMDEFWNKVVEEYNKIYPNVNVSLELSPAIHESVRPRFLSGNAPDVYYMGGNANIDTATFMAEGKFLDLTDLYENGEALGYEGTLKDNRSIEILQEYEGKIYAMAFACSVNGYYYNKGMAEENNWQPPKTWEEFLELAPKIKEKGIYPIIHTGKYPDYMEHGFMQPGYAADGGRELLVDMANLKPEAYENDALVAAWKKLEVVRDNEWLPTNALSMTHTEAQMEWLQGKAFMIPCGNWLEGEMSADIPEGFEMEFMPSFWYDSDNKPQYIAIGAPIAISKDTKNPEAAKAFLKVLYSKPVTALIAEYGMGIPCVKDPLENIEMTPSCAAVVEQMNNDEVGFIVEKGGSGNFEPYAQLRDVLYGNVAAVLSGEKSAEKALDDIQQEVKRIADDASITKVTIS